MFYGIDSFFLEKAEQFSNWFQRWFGKDCFWLSVQLYVFRAGVYGYYCWKTDNLYGLAFEIILFPLLLISISLVKGRTYQALERNLKNPFTTALHIVRLFQIALFIVSLSSYLKTNEEILTWIPIVSIFLFAIIMYLVSCTPLPPQTSKVGEFIKSITASLKPANATVGA